MAVKRALIIKNGLVQELPTSDLLDVGIVPLSIATKTANYTVTEDDELILVDCSSGAVTISLLASPTNTGQYWTIKKTDKSGFDLTIDPLGSPLIEGDTDLIVSSTGQNDINTSITVVWDGTNYHVI